MRNHRRYVMLAPVIFLVVTFAAPTVEAGGGVGVHLGTSGFGVSLGFGDWSVYTSSWSDPYWSIDFNATLSGYGEWVWVSGLGRVWRPWVATSWRPYTHGRWVSTGCGLTWVAYEPWGYVPHHYGSWAYASFGWVWVPGYSYSCANVVWVGSGGYIGWYARAPWGWSHAHHGFRHGYQHGFRDGYYKGYSDGWHDARYATYVDWRHLGSDNVSRHAVTHRIVSQNHIEARAGAPSRNEIRQRGGAAITETRLTRRSVRVDGRDVTIARPEGVVPSIERNAAETVASSLAERALERRQPLVRPRSARSAGTESSSRPGGVDREARMPQVRSWNRESSSSRSQPSAIATRSSHDPIAMTDPPGTRTSSGSSGLRFGTRRESGRVPQIESRSADAPATAERQRSRSAPSISSPIRSTSASRRVAQQPQEMSSSQRSKERERLPVTANRRVAPTERRASESNRSQSRIARPSATRSQPNSDEKRSEEPSRRRRR
jgi:hypothetical protein